MGLGPGLGWAASPGGLLGRAVGLGGYLGPPAEFGRYSLWIREICPYLSVLVHLGCSARLGRFLPGGQNQVNVSAICTLSVRFCPPLVRFCPD
jgi:hypothetical protein